MANLINSTWKNFLKISIHNINMIAEHQMKLFFSVHKITLLK